MMRHNTPSHPRVHQVANSAFRFLRQPQRAEARSLPASATCAKETRCFPAPGGDRLYAARAVTVCLRVRSVEQASADITRGSSCCGGDAAASGGIVLRGLCEGAAHGATESTSRRCGCALWGRGRVELGICASSDGCAPHSTPDDR
jgi:hypothetical protein